MRATPGEVLYYYDGPLMLLLHGEGGELFIAMVVEEEEKTQYYLCTEITQEAFEAVRENKMDLRSAFTFSPLTYMTDLMDDPAILKPVELNEDWLQDEGVYLKF